MDSLSKCFDVLGEKIKQLEVELAVNKYQIQNLQATIQQLKEEDHTDKKMV